MSPPEDDRRASPDSMRKHGNNLHKNVNEHLQNSWNSLQGSRAVTQSNFTATSYVFSMAYTAAIDIQEEDLETKKRVLNKFRELLGKSATKWADAETKSTLRKA